MVQGKTFVTVARLSAFIALMASVGCIAAEGTDVELDIISEESALAAATTGTKKGLTWQKISHDSTKGQDYVGCNNNCNAYQGDTPCTTSLPILCINKDGSASNGYVAQNYAGWAAGNIALTPSVLGTELSSLAEANWLCSATFGAGWRMAEHHDAGYPGWGYRAYGNILGATRFWTHINDQPANCWDPMQ